ncbi:hypothetical protein KMZ68_11670 [Bradyrhizobium sediminis]|uniref:Uncharacterized protein n=1 Tax=Bradyrhizobium sediminis TaxID=2840469 RepID=A0A975RVF7_9BRAD|nr:hypothetical protein KMZ68_11670 [Bradyrhizobium sediminis]
MLDAVDGDGHFDPFRNGADRSPIVGYCGGPRPLALALFAAVLAASVATYLHHATDTLKLSF